MSISIARLESTDRAGCLAGLGGGGVLTTVMIITSDVVSLKERGIYQSISGVVVAASNSLGPLIGGAVTEKLSWRWCFVRFSVLPLTRDENLLTVKVHRHPARICLNPGGRIPSANQTSQGQHPVETIQDRLPRLRCHDGIGGADPDPHQLASTTVVV